MCEPGTSGAAGLAVCKGGALGQLHNRSVISCSQLWAYDDLQTLSSQPGLSTQLGKKPAAAFCPSCGVFTLDIGPTQADRDRHVSSCREQGEPEAGGAHSDGEEENEAVSEKAAEEEPSSNPVGKKQCTSENASPSEADIAPSNLSAADSLSGPFLTGTDSGRAVLSGGSSNSQDCVEVNVWLEQNQLGSHAAAFQRAGVTAPLLRHLTDADLQQLGINALERRKTILAAIENTTGSQQQESASRAPGAGALQVIMHVPLLTALLACSWHGGML